MHGAAAGSSARSSLLLRGAVFINPAMVEDGITRPWDCRRGRTAAVILDGNTPGESRYRCKAIGSCSRAQELLLQGHPDLDSNGDDEACASLKP